MPEERRFDRGAWLVLLFALIFITLDVAQLAYRFSLPTEGWLVNESALDNRPRFPTEPESGRGALFPAARGRSPRLAASPLNKFCKTRPGPSLKRPRVGKSRQVPVTVVRDGQMVTFRFQSSVGRWRHRWQANFGESLSIISWLSSLILLGVGILTFFNRPQNLAGAVFVPFRYDLACDYLKQFPPG